MTPRPPWRDGTRSTLGLLPPHRARVADRARSSLVAPCATPCARPCCGLRLAPPSHQCALISYVFEQTRAYFRRKLGASPLPQGRAVGSPLGESRLRRARRRRAEGREGR